MIKYIKRAGGDQAWTTTPYQIEVHIPVPESGRNLVHVGFIELKQV
jgi:hypothetical protein